MSRREVKVEMNTMLKILLSGEIGTPGQSLRTQVVFTREEKVEIPQGCDGVYSVAWGKETQPSDMAELCGAQVRVLPCMVDMYGRDGEKTDLLYEELLSLLRDNEATYFTVMRCEPEQLYSENHQSDGVRATIMCQYVG